MLSLVVLGLGASLAVAEEARPRPTGEAPVAVVAPAKVFSVQLEKPDKPEKPADAAQLEKPEKADSVKGPPWAPLLRRPRPPKVQLLSGRFEEPRKSLAYRLKNAPATDVAGALNEFLSSQRRAAEKGGGVRAVVVPEPVSNTVLISAPEKEIEDLEGLIKQLDASPQMVMVRVMIAELAPAGSQEEGGGEDADAEDVASPAEEDDDAAEQIRALRKQGRLKTLFQPQIVALDNQPAYLQIGRREPRIVGARLEGGTRTNQMELENVGLSLGVTARISPDRVVVMELDVEMSNIARDDEGVPLTISQAGEETRIHGIDTLMAQTTLAVADGRTIVLGGLAEKLASGRTELVIAATATIIEPEAKAAGKKK